MRNLNTVERGVCDLTWIDQELRGEHGYAHDGHAARTLVRESDLRIILLAMKGGARLAKHRVEHTACLQMLSGHVRVRLPDQTVEVTAGQLLVIDSGAEHDVDAVSEASALLTIGWPARAGAER
jgi:quercetin dioxygenase-like cupin family protein